MVRCNRQTEKRCPQPAIDVHQHKYFCEEHYRQATGAVSLNAVLSQEERMTLTEEKIAVFFFQRLQAETEALYLKSSREPGVTYWWDREDKEDEN